MVEAGGDYLVRNAGGGADSGTGEGVHFDGVAACERSCYLGGRRRGVAGDSLRLCRGKFFRLLPRAVDGSVDVDRLLLQHDGTGGGRYYAGSGGVCFWTGRI